MKIIPVYLPQFHTIPENDEWWGKGFTEWTNVKAARPYFEGHNQPRVPQGDNYYDLQDVEVLKWQCKLAKEHGIYGFCMYHYWFSGKLLLEKPMEILLAHPEIDIKYCISWANGEWRDIWNPKNRDSQILIFDDFNNEQGWVDHFNYMLPFFKDPRYMTEKNKPLMVIYSPNLILKLNKMLDCWTKMAQDAGFDGLTYIYQSASAMLDKSWDRSKFSYGVQMNPGYVQGVFSKQKSVLPQWSLKYIREIKRLLNIRKSLLKTKAASGVTTFDYDEAWQNMLRLRPEEEGKIIPCAFSDWDNTPRYRDKGWLYTDVSTQRFKHYLSLLVENTKKYYKVDKIFVFAWNEWGEGGYLEPDELYGDGFLKAIKEVMDEQETMSD